MTRIDTIEQRQRRDREIDTLQRVRDHYAKAKDACQQQIDRLDQEIAALKEQG